MSLRTYFAAAAALMLAVPAVEAQDPGTVEVGVHAHFSGSDRQTGLDNARGVGGSLGVFLSQRFSIEAAAAHAWTEDRNPRTGDGSWLPIRGRVLFNFRPLDRVRPFVGAGVVRNVRSGIVSGGDTGAGGIAGIRLFFNESVALRSDLTIDRVWAPFNEGVTIRESVVDSHTNWAITTGLSFLVGGTPRDSDGDGVPDRDDQCAATPMGVSVDAVGCRVDSDGDGVFDEADACAGTPAMVSVDARGCRVDADGDGVYDEDDACANTPSGVRVDRAGCRVDADGDGVFDEDDACANTPSGVSVDDRGCRLDSDGDGVFDEDDRCANSPRGEAVDANGCPVLFEAEETTLVLEGVNFETSSAELTAEARTVLDRVAAALVGNPDVRVRVEGHTDASGARSFNVDLSQARAESVAAYLTQQGVAADRMEAVGYGPDEPVADNGTAEGRQQNRRVELERIGGEG
ncbi:MAG: OmpA family protein [Gemmatimonadota bacterium]